MMNPSTFTIDIHQSQIDRLRKKLKLTDLPDELEGASWDLGSPLAGIKRLVEVWKTWDWKKAEEKLNALPNFHTDIEVEGFGNLDIHFIHRPSKIKNAIPLLFVHGWPGCFLEVQKILPLLADKDDTSPAFHIVAPSLPNFGFSQGVKNRGFALAQYAETCHKLMLQLGYNEYVTQAGDWGFWISRALGKLYPNHVKASHINMVYAKAPSFTTSPLLALQNSITPYSEADKKAIEKTEIFRKEGMGYNVLQSTKPQTIAYALQDSPVALLAWIYEELHDWSDDYKWTDDEILTWISIYYFSRAGPGASARIYYETMHSKTCTYDELQEYTGGVKLGLTFSHKELHSFPQLWGHTLGKVVYTAEHDRGGHFYAYEQPDLLVRDLKAMFGKDGVFFQ